MKGQELKKRFEKAYDNWSEKIFGFVVYKVSDREKAIDITQETFVKTWDYLCAGNDIKNLKAFLYRTANNMVIDEYRKRGRRKETSLDNMREDGFQLQSDGDDVIRNNSEYSSVLRIVENLPPIYSEAVTLRLVEEMSIKDIADVLNEKATTVSVRVHRGTRMLKKMLKE